MAMESRVFHAGSSVASSRACFVVSSARAGSGHRQGQQGFQVAAQRFMRGAKLRDVGIECGRCGKKGSRSEGIVAAARKSTPEQEEYVVTKNDSNEYIESIAESQGSGSSYIGSPLLWIGVGVGLSALFSFGANSVKRYAMQQMLKSMSGGAGGPGASPFGAPGGNPFAGMPMPPPGAGFPFPMPPTGSVSSPVSAAAAAAPVDVSPNVTSSQPSVVSETPKSSTEPKIAAFTDVNATEILEREQQAAAAAAASRFSDQSPSAQEPTRPFFADSEVVDSKGGSYSGAGAGPSNDPWDSAGKAKQTVFSVEQLEKMMEDPTVQKMVYPYLPEEMRNPTTFKWMMQNPQYRQQLQDMLNSMGGDGAWDNRMSDMLKNFDLNSTEVKQQFEQIGLTPEEVVAKIMANPEVAVAFQNPKVQAAIMDCSTNPLNITKYQNDKEVMDVFNKISELFPGMAGSPF
ncbi:protein TIC 40, chloroplastic [Physcomitrium patens]|uniref:Protein TIC 40, chloroplastic n=1 Tax=Physcomitrium patens TaxID=3218 RepID=A0A2K1KQ09_PHYPA|nr:protein TIC 40, chloroplastic-like [Physcomitrium patens]PNR55857.1 hypothetical protein PHYPA_006754 [Physcomitrium patens]|eukprot:XP_024374522.1 protein TIC 40, chloroplastic-like [Physcomitrella patens]